jgi:tRNA A-37 threonylcarbamoyl transferase component Bud32
MIQKKLHALLPKYVPRALSYRKGVMVSEKLGMSLKTWLRSHPNVTRQVLTQIVKNVRLILMKIRRKYPGFRHMDLHLGNLLFYKGRIMIIDFGMSKFKAGSTSPCYDYHFFLNSLRSFMLKIRRRNTLPYLNKLLPDGFRGCNGKYVSNFRMKTSESAASIAKRLLGFRA